MRKTNKVLMKYLYRQERKEKCVTLEDVLDWTREGKYRHRVEAVRGLDEVAMTGGMVSGPLAADDLPVVMPAVGERGGYTGLVLLSFRVDGGMEVLERLRSVVNLWEQTLMSFVGTSGRSLKVLIPYRLMDGGLPADAAQVALFQQYAYKRAAEYALASTGVRAEETVHDGTEHFRISFDPRAYYHPEARPIGMEQPTEPLTEQSAQVVAEPAETGLDTELLPGYTRREMDVTKYNFICRELAFGQDMDREEYLMTLATECRQAGIDKELATKLTIRLTEFFQKEILVRSSFNNAYEKHRQGRSNPIEKSLMHQQLLEEFLRRRYLFRRNRVTGDIEYQEKHRYQLSWKPLTQEVQNDINNEAIREGIKVWPKDLERILISERIDEYDPVREWFSALPQWDGRDRLGEMADRVKTLTPGWRDNFKIWMRSMVSQWRAGKDALYGAQMVLMMVGAQGTRKSTFMRMLLPRELMPFYIDRIDFTNRKEALRALSRFLLINIDEYDQVSKAQTAFLKHLIQRTDVKERKLYSTTFEQSQRYAAFCATTNSLVPLKDDSGSRRYLVVEVNEVIDTDTQGDKAIDYPQLYAQTVYEIEHGEEYAFTGEREQQIVEQNADYYETPNVISLFEDLFHQPQAGDEVLLLSPTEILERIRNQKKTNVVTQANATLLGSYLHRKGYRKQRRSYLVSLN
ncbi:MAG: hypothetical protein IJJ56_04470 [Prevotella sp.]|nr:hypothetical protein [Prevotella sp.]